MADRPGEVGAEWPEGEAFGSPGPDQGYALTLAPLLASRLELTEGLHEADALAVATAVGLKRASQFGRAPILADLVVGAQIWGLLDGSPPRELVDIRAELFEEAHHRHDYMRLRAIVDATPAEFLHRPIGTIEADLASDPWAGLANLAR